MVVIQQVRGTAIGRVCRLHGLVALCLLCLNLPLCKMDIVAPASCNVT